MAGRGHRGSSGDLARCVEMRISPQMNRIKNTIGVLEPSNWDLILQTHLEERRRFCTSRLRHPRIMMAEPWWAHHDWLERQEWLIGFVKGNSKMTDTPKPNRRGLNLSQADRERGGKTSASRQRRDARGQVRKPFIFERSLDKRHFMSYVS